MMVSQDPYWMKHSMNVLAGLSRRYGLAANVPKSRRMTCQTSILRSRMSEEAKTLKCTLVGDLFRVRLRTRIPFPECRVKFTARSMTEHRRRMHRMEPAIYRIWILVSHTEHQPQV